MYLFREFWMMSFAGQEQCFLAVLDIFHLACKTIDNQLTFLKDCF